MLRKCSYTYRERELPNGLLLVLKLKALYFRAQRVRTESRIVGRRLRHNDGEFLAAVTTTYIGGAEESAKQIGKGLKHHVSCIMAESVIESLEMVEVEEKNGDGLLLASS